MENNHLDEALVGIRKIMRAVEINSLSLAKKSRLTPTQHIVLQLISNKETTTPSNISKITTFPLNKFFFLKIFSLIIELFCSIR